MKYEKIANYSGAKVRRITGVKRSMFEKMVEILKKGYARKHQRRGRHQKLRSALAEHLNKTRETKCGFQVRKILFSSSK